MREEISSDVKARSQATMGMVKAEASFTVGGQSRPGQNGEDFGRELRAGGRMRVQKIKISAKASVNKRWMRVGREHGS